MKKSKGVDGIVHVVRNMLLPTAALRPSAHGVWINLLRAARNVEGFEKCLCCTGNARQYDNTSIDSVMKEIATMSLDANKVEEVESPEVDWAKVLERYEKPFKTSPF